MIDGRSHPVLHAGDSLSVSLDNLTEGLPRSTRCIAGALRVGLHLSVDAVGAISARLALRRAPKPTLIIPDQHLARAASAIVDLAASYASAVARTSRLAPPARLSVVGDGARMVARHRARVRREATAARVRAIELEAEAARAEKARRVAPTPPTPAQLEQAREQAEIQAIVSLVRAHPRARH